MTINLANYLNGAPMRLTDVLDALATAAGRLHNNDGARALVSALATARSYVTTEDESYVVRDVARVASAQTFADAIDSLQSIDLGAFASVIEVARQLAQSFDL